MEKEEDCANSARAYLTTFLDTNSFVFERHEHPAIMTIAEAQAHMVDFPLPGTMLKNLFLRDKKGTRHFLVSIPGSSHINLTSLASLLGVTRLELTSPQRLWDHLAVLCVTLRTRE